METQESDHRPIVFFDARCGLCDRVVQRLLDSDPDGKLRFAPLGGESALNYLEGTGLEGATETPGTFVFLEFDEAGEPRITTRSTAAIRCSLTLGGWYSLLWPGLLIPAFLRDAMYNLVARNRYRWFGEAETCRIPSADERGRFLP